MQITEFRTDIPKWAVGQMMTVCPYCNHYIADNSDTGVTTARWCTNKRCPGHMAHKMKYVADFFGVKNFGPETARSYIQSHNCRNHLEIIKEWYKDEKPLVTLADVADLACIEGYGDTQAVKDLNCYSSFEAYFANMTTANPLLRSNAEYLLECETYFNLKPPLAKTKISVMGTGSFKGFNSREEYFNLLNDVFGQHVQVIQTGKRKTGIAYLIKEPEAVDHSKSQIARDYNIPIVTPSEFIKLLSDWTSISI